MHKSRKLLVVAALVVTGVATRASAYPGSIPTDYAVTMGFDEMSGGTGTVIPNGYYGFEWTNFTLQTYATRTPSIGFTTFPNVGVAGPDTTGTLLNPGNTFTLYSVNVYDPVGDTVTLTGYNDYLGTTPYTTTYPITPGLRSGSQTIELDWENITRVTFSGSGAGYDSFVVQAPEPVTSAALLVSGLGIVFAARRRRASMIVVPTE
jgi:hypothetical protein